MENTGRNLEVFPRNYQVLEKFIQSTTDLARASVKCHVSEAQIPTIKAQRRAVSMKNKCDVSISLAGMALNDEQEEAIAKSIKEESSVWDLPFSDCRITKDHNILLRLARPQTFQQVLQQTDLQYGNQARSGHQVVVNIVCSSNSVAEIRCLLIGNHLAKLLETQGYTVTLLNSSFQMPKEDSCQQLKLIQDSFNKKIINYFKAEEISCELKETLFRKLVQSSYNIHKQGDNNDGLSPDKTVTLNLKNFIEKQRLKQGKGGYDTSINLLTVNKDNNHLLQLCALQEILQKMDTEPDFIIHIVPYEKQFAQEQFDLLWKLVSPEMMKATQVHVPVGPIVRKQPMEMVDFLNLREKQTTEASVLKYGDSVRGSGWKSTIQSLTLAVIKFEILTTIGQHPLKLDLTPTGTTQDIKGGSFVMYNCARLATLFQHFDEAVEKGLYPPLPAMDTIDFSTLREEEEWFLLYNYILPYPSLLQACVEFPRDMLRPTIHTHKVCSFISSLCREFSSYYSRIHVLGEPRSHLLPVMYARLYLLKSVQQVLTNALTLLGIKPMSQL